MIKKLILNKLSNLGIPVEELNRYDEPHRFYHNRQHIESMISNAIQAQLLTDELFLAIVFHDIIYNPKSNNNEELSAELFCKYFDNFSFSQIIKDAILDTKTHKPTNEISRQLCNLDLDILYRDYETFIDFEHKIFKEYQWVDYSIYKESRVRILSDLGVDSERLNYVKNRKPNIAVYPGSFNPFHKGHYNILQKAEQIFDKVIIARGINTDKGITEWDLPSKVQFRQIESYSGLLTDLIDEMEYDVTIVRGLRNTTDLQYELTQYRFLQELKPNIKVISIFCDKEYEHVSSSAIRQLNKFNKAGNYLLD